MARSAKGPVGRPPGGGVRYSEEKGREIADLHAKGMEIGDICKLPDMPGWRTVYLWMTKYPAFKVMMDTARLELADWYAEEVLRMAGDVTPKNWTAQRERIQAYKWRATVLNPAKYSERQRLEIEDVTTASTKELIESAKDLLQALGIPNVEALDQIEDHDADAR